VFWQVTMHAIDEGTVVFPKVPLIRLEGPLLLVQLMETPFLTMVNFARSEHLGILA
jgi:nicotinate phosphoribosyltransferase